MQPHGFYAGVGSRETPEDVLELMRQMAYYLAHLGWGLRSGGATGADEAFYRGARDCPVFNPRSMAHIYLVGAKWEQYRPQPEIGLYHSQLFTETWPEAQEIAFAARGNFEGLKETGRDLHTRNAYQILHHTLKQPVLQTICWAKPVGRKGLVRGGTNTAVQISRQRNIPVMNLFEDEERVKAELFVERMRVRFKDHLPFG